MLSYIRILIPLGGTQGLAAEYYPTASAPHPQWLNTHSYRNTAALSAQEARPGWGCTAAYSRRLTLTIVTRISDSDFPILSLSKDNVVSGLFFFFLTFGSILKCSQEHNSFLMLYSNHMTIQITF